MRKILIIGCSGAGKSVLASELGTITGLPVIHLDAHYWRPGWERPPKEDWLKIVGELLERDSWIMDGNYGSTLDWRISECDTVIFLAYSRWLCLYRVFKRGITFFGKTRVDLNPGCKEHLPDWGFLSWIWNYRKQSQPKVMGKLQSLKSDKLIFMLKSPSETRDFLLRLRSDLGSVNAS